MKMERSLKRTWAEINLDNLAENYQKLRQQVKPGTKFLGVVKADAYGHGAIWVSRKLEQLGADYLAVSNVEEAEELRHNGVHMPILLLGYTPENMTETLIANDVTQDVPSLEMARAYSAEAGRLGKVLRVHLKLDTGMGRLGFQCDEEHFEQSLQEILEAVRLPNLDWEGVFMHFSVSDEPDSIRCREFTKLQHERFVHMITEVESRADMHFRLHHCCNAGGVAFFPEYAWDMVRPGILLYGSGDMAQEMGLKPVMTLKAAIGPVKVFEPGASISYGRTYFTTGYERIGVVPIGYADGLFRLNSNRWQMLTRDGLAPIRGRICMDMCMIDLTDLPNIGTGDVVEVFGEHNLVNDMAKQVQTIPYELLCAISKRVPRLYLEGGKVIDHNLQLLL